MDKIEIKANAKINLTLDVLSKRNDGYHELEMIMLQIPLYDNITIEKADNIIVNSNLNYLSDNEKNTAYKAAKAIFGYVGKNYGAKINIIKNIPIGAGLGGGSADAAAVLKGLNELYHLCLSQQQLENIGDTIGKDIPFCIRGGICLAKGTGEKLIDLGIMPNCYIVLVKPDNISVSTSEVFSRVNLKNIELHPHTKGVINCIGNNDILGISRRLYNVLEPITAEIYPIIGEIKGEFINNGALGAAMSGSGSSVFGIFSDIEKAKYTYSYFSETYKQSYLLEIKKNKSH